MTVTIITGTDTNVGKTVTTAALVVRAWHAGRSAYVIKPAQTCLITEPGDLTRFSAWSAMSRGTSVSS